LACILLLWVYYSCQILLYGAEFTRVWAARHGVKPKPEVFAVKDPDAVNPKSALG
jgi:membrane protein